MNEWTHKHELEFKAHLKEIEDMQERKARAIYEGQKELFIRNNIERTSQEIAEKITPLIEEYRGVSAELRKVFRKCGVPFRASDDLPEIAEDDIETLLTREFNSKYEKRLDEVIETITLMRHKSTEAVLFGDEKEQQIILRDFRDMKVEL